MEKKSQRARELTTSSELDELAASIMALTANAGELGFLQAPDPKCLGRPDAECAENGHRHAEHQHEHDRGHGHEHEHEREHPHEHPPAEEPELEHGHEHMRVFPVFLMSKAGELVEAVSEQGEVTDAVQRLQDTNLVRLKGHEASTKTSSKPEAASKRKHGKTPRKSQS